MLAQQRQAAILDLVRRQGGVRVSHLVREFGVSDMTIRRDLEVLAERGLRRQGARRRHHARAADPPRSPGSPPSRSASAPRRPPSPRRAAQLVEPGTAIALSAGTTTAALAALLLDVPGPDRGHQLDAGRRRALPQSGAPTRPWCSPAGSAPPPTRWSARSRWPPSRSLNVDVLFLGVHGMSAARRLHHAQPDGGRDQPRARRRGPPARRAGRPHQVGHGRHRHDRRRSRTPTCSSPTPACPPRRAVPAQRPGRRADRRGPHTGMRSEEDRDRTSADGRELIYFDETRRRPSATRVDRRDLPPPPPASEMRYDPLLDEWVPIAAHRQTRTHLPPTDECPLCPSTPEQAERDPGVGLRRGGLREPLPVFATGRRLAHPPPRR